MITPVGTPRVGVGAIGTGGARPKELNNTTISAIIMTTRRMIVLGASVRRLRSPRPGAARDAVIVSAERDGLGAGRCRAPVGASVVGSERGESLTARCFGGDSMPSIARLASYN